MNVVIRALIELAISWWTGRLQSRTFRDAKVRGLKTYLKVLQGARWSLMGVVSLFAMIQFMCLGLAVMLAAGVFLSPWEMDQKLWAALGVGAFLFIIPAIVMMILFSQRLWYRVSGASKMVDKVLTSQNDTNSASN
jgi:hypothetical protein